MNLEVSDIPGYQGLRQIDFGRLASLRIKPNAHANDREGLNLTIIFVSSLHPDSGYLHLEFWWVQQLRLGSFDGLLNYVVDISEVPFRYQEHERFMVTEQEYDLFSFTCQNFTAGFTKEF